MSTLAGLDAETAPKFVEAISGEGGDFILQIMAGMDRQSDAMTRQVEENQAVSLREAQEIFVEFFDAVEALVPKLDSMRLSALVSRYTWQRDFTVEQIEAVSR